MQGIPGLHLVMNPGLRCRFPQPAINIIILHWGSEVHLIGIYTSELDSLLRHAKAVKVK
jgi:hypothetical protein